MSLLRDPPCQRCCASSDPRDSRQVKERNYADNAHVPRRGGNTRDQIVSFTMSNIVCVAV